MKKIWTALADFDYKNDSYMVLLSEHYEFFVMKTTNDKYDYPTLEEYLEIKKDFTNNNYNQNVPINKNNKNNNKYKKNNKNNKGKKFRFKPLIYIGGLLVPLSIALVIISEANKKDFSYTTGNRYESEILKEITSLTDEDNVRDGDYEWLPTFKVYCTPEEFGNYIDKKNITWDDCIEAAQNNNNLGEKYQSIIIKGLNNLKNSGLNYNLAPLYHNISTVRVEERGFNDNFTGGMFVAKEHLIYVQKNIESYGSDVLVFCVLHELLGHGSNTAYIDDNVWCAFGAPTIITPPGKEGESFCDNLYGNVYDEGIADTIACIATGGKATNSMGYPVPMAIIETISQTCNISISEILNKGIFGIIEALQRIGYDRQNAIDFAEYLESCYSTSLASPNVIDITDRIMSLYANRLFKDAQNGKTKEEIIEFLNGINSIAIHSETYNGLILDSNTHSLLINQKAAYEQMLNFVDKNLSTYFNDNEGEKTPSIK